MPDLTGDSLLFVYGTLRQAAGHPMHALLASHADDLGPARLQGRLYVIAHYPGIVLSDQPHEQVRGELYRIRDESVLDQLDDYEECSTQFPEPHEYRRELVRVSLDNGEVMRAWTYLYNHQTEKLPQIASGDWLDR